MAGAVLKPTMGKAPTACVCVLCVGAYTVVDAHEVDEPFGGVGERRAAPVENALEVTHGPHARPVIDDLERHTTHSGRE